MCVTRNNVRTGQHMKTLTTHYITTLLPPSSCILPYGRIIACKLPVRSKVLGKPSRVYPDTGLVISTTFHCMVPHSLCSDQGVNQAPLW